MAEILNLIEKVRTAVGLGESHFREFKSALHGEPARRSPRSTRDICKDIGETLVAFANADGGELLVGIEDGGEISGTSALDDKVIQQLLEAPVTHVHKDTPLQSVKSSVVEIDGERVLYFSVLKSASKIHLTAAGRCLMRQDLESVPIPPRDIQFERVERRSREYDREFVDGASIGDLDHALVQTVAEQLSPGMSGEKCLQYLDLAEFSATGLRLRRAALLLFAREPQRWHPRIQVRILKVNGTDVLTGDDYNVASDELVNGNILTLIDSTWDRLRPYLVNTKLGADAKFTTTYVYPELACREALVNAIAHRDYSNEGQGIEIYLFNNRIEVVNPGELLSSLSMEELLQLEGIHQSRNAFVARVLREVGYMRELGEGLRRIFDLMHKNELASPKVESGNQEFKVSFEHRPMYSNEEQLWLDQFSSLKLSREQKAIVLLGRRGTLIAPQDIIDDLGIVDIEHYRQLIQSLQTLGVISSEIHKNKASSIARKKRVSARDIPRFKISPPKSESDWAEVAPGQEEFELDGSNDERGEQDSGIAEVEASRRIWVGNLPFDATRSEVIDVIVATRSDSYRS